MNYSFFGTSANDYQQLLGCLETIIQQNIQPAQIILVNSGEKEIKREEIEFFYRGSNLSNELIITSVILKGKKQLREILKTKKQNDK